MEETVTRDSLAAKQKHGDDFSWHLSMKLSAKHGEEKWVRPTTFPRPRSEGKMIENRYGKK